MKSMIVVTRVLSYLFALGIATFAAVSVSAAAPPRPAGPCDIYAANTPCVAAHSTTRALYASYNGPLYQVKREADAKTLDIRVDAGGYANAAAQDSFCLNTLCVINRIYDQSGHSNDLLQAAPGTFKGVVQGAFDTQPIADMAPITIHGHKAYGVYIIPGMGFRNNNASGIAINDEPEGIYYVIDGTHYDSGCCFDYGNSSTNGRAVGTGTMETTYFGTSTTWGSGAGAGPWIMSDMEAGLFSGHGAKQNIGDPTIDSWRFVTAVMDGGGGNHWDLRGGNAQSGGLTTFYSGERPAAGRSGGYFPMHKQGGILLGTGGDNGNGSSGTFYEGVMTSGFPTETTTDAVQANVVAAKYEVARIALSRVVGFTPGSPQQVTETFTNTTGEPINGLRMSVAGPTPQWRVAANGRAASQSISDTLAPGASMSATFDVTSPAATGAGYLTARASWKLPSSPAIHTETATERIRNVFPVKINEFALGSAANPTDQFIELYNAADQAVDISNWSLTATAGQWSPTLLATVPNATKLPAHGFYLLGLAGSGLAAPANAGATTVFVRNATGFSARQSVEIGGEARTIKSVGSAASPLTTIFIPVSTDAFHNFPAGSTTLPVTSVAGFEAGQQIAIDLGGHFEVARVKSVGKPGTQTTLTADASAGATAIKIAAASSITPGDTLTIGTGAHKETVRVTNVGSAQVGVAAPLKFDHANGIDVSDLGTGIVFSPATRFAHSAGQALQALGSGVVLDRPLMRSHPIGSAVINKEVSAGYQGTSAPNQWFGTVLSAGSGSVVLKDVSGNAIVDAIVYTSQQSNSSGNGVIPSPELATLVSGQDKGGCIVPAGNAGGAGGGTGRPAGPARSWGRYPDGADTGSLCADFHAQTATTLAVASAVDAANIKVASADDFRAGQTVQVGLGADQESATITSVGTPGAGMTGAAVTAGATSIPMAGAFAFRPGQTIAIGGGSEQETAVVAAGARRGAPTVMVESPLKLAHPAGTQVAGTGITLSSPLARAHAGGSLVTDNSPTPGAVNRYSAH